MKHYEKQNAIQRELKGYKGNKILMEFYRSILDDYENDLMQSQCCLHRCEEDFDRIEKNLDYLLKRINLLPKREREFLTDVFIQNDLTIEEIYKKYELNQRKFHYYCEKIMFAFAEMDQL